MKQTEMREDIVAEGRHQAFKEANDKCETCKSALDKGKKEWGLNCWNKGHKEALEKVEKIIEHFEAEMMNTISNFRYEDKTDLIDYLDDADKIIEKELKSKLKEIK